VGWFHIDQFFLQVIHPIHDQAFFLTSDHKRRLKEEYGKSKNML
jgi:hypothetical protein